MKYFCSKCGKTTQYNFELPKFCAFCGQSFASKPSSAQPEDKRNKFLNELKLKKNINSIKIEEDILYNSENIEEGDYQISDFKKIKPSFKLDIYQSKGESFGSLIDNPSAPIDTNNQSNNQSKTQIKTKEEILAEFQKEAGSLRSK
jgi:rRNA maturation protein Nop10